jgi:hypothetical protein
VNLPFEITSLKRISTKTIQSNREFSGLEPISGLSFQLYSNY